MEGNKSRGPSVETTSIYVAMHNINLGDPIDATMVSLQEWPKDKVPQGALTSLEDVEGRRPRTAIFAGEPILDGKLLAQGEQHDPITQLRPGMRLATISVDAEKSAAGLLSPGDRVDVQVFVRADQRAGIEKATTKIFLQNIRVFAVEQMVQRSADGGDARSIPKTVSLMVTPEQASKIDFAQHIGELSLIPRSPNDETLATDFAVGFDDLFQDASEKNTREDEQNRDAVAQSEQNDGQYVVDMMKEPEVEVIPPFQMEVYLADEVTIEEFDPASGKLIHKANRAEEAAPKPATREPATAAPKASEGASIPDDFPIQFDGE